MVQIFSEISFEVLVCLPKWFFSQAPLISDFSSNLCKLKHCQMKLWGFFSISYLIHTTNICLIKIILKKYFSFKIDWKGNGSILLLKSHCRPLIGMCILQDSLAKTIWKNIDHGKSNTHKIVKELWLIQWPFLTNSIRIRKRQKPMACKWKNYCDFLPTNLSL